MTEPSASTTKQCAGICKDGSPCTSQLLADDWYCYAHSPGRDRERAEARRRGGRHRSNAARLRGLMPPRLMPVFDRLEQALAQVHDGGLDPKRAQAMAAVAGAMTRVLTVGELEERLRRLEARGDGGGEGDDVAERWRSA